MMAVTLCLHMIYFQNVDGLHLRHVELSPLSLSCIWNGVSPKQLACAPCVQMPHSIAPSGFREHSKQLETSQLGTLKDRNRNVYSTFEGTQL